MQHAAALQLEVTNYSYASSAKVPYKWTSSDKYKHRKYKIFRQQSTLIVLRVMGRIVHKPQRKRVSVQELNYILSTNTNYPSIKYPTAFPVLTDKVPKYKYPSSKVQEFK